MVICWKWLPMGQPLRRIANNSASAWVLGLSWFVCEFVLDIIIKVSSDLCILHTCIYGCIIALDPCHSWLTIWCYFIWHMISTERHIWHLISTERHIWHLISTERHIRSWKIFCKQHPHRAACNTLWFTSVDMPINYKWCHMERFIGDAVSACSPSPPSPGFTVRYNQYLLSYFSPSVGSRDWYLF